MVAKDVVHVMTSVKVAIDRHTRAVVAVVAAGAAARFLVVLQQEDPG